MRQFFISFMAALAGCWLSIFLSFFGIIAFFGMVAASLGNISEKGGVSSVSSHTLLSIDLGATITERETPSDQFTSILGGGDNPTLSIDELTAAIRHAATDDDIDGIVLKCNGINAGLAQIEVIARELREFRKTDKWIYAFADNLGQADYILASQADSIFINPIGIVDIHGLASTVTFFKGLLDKIGVEMQVVKVGTFKSAVEPYIMTEMSEANRQQMTEFLDNIWKFLGNEIKQGRQIGFDRLNQIADSACYSKPLGYYISNHLVDAGLYSHQFRDKIAELTLGSHSDEPKMISVADYVAARSIKPFPTKGRKRIAVLYAVGSIVDQGDDGIVGATMVPEIYRLTENNDIDGLILRVNSGGGSAYASEQIWEALEKFKATGRPFYVSMSDYAASGGYYISCGADKIFAEHLTLTGSIGIFGLIPNAEKLLTDKLGITTETVATNPSGAFPGLTKAMTPEQRNAMQNHVNRGYELFTSRVARGRDLPIDSVKAIAEGRVWDGMTALRIGLVDRLGGLHDAIAAMEEEIADGERCRIEQFPNLEFDFWSEMRRSIPSLRAAMVSSELGEAYPLYRRIRALKEMDPLQARMEMQIEY